MGFIEFAKKSRFFNIEYSNSLKDPKSQQLYTIISGILELIVRISFTVSLMALISKIEMFSLTDLANLATTLLTSNL